MPEHEEPLLDELPAEGGEDEDEDEDEDALDRLRDLPVGTNDPNIVGDVGPTDIPPGADPPAP